MCNKPDDSNSRRPQPLSVLFLDWSDFTLSAYCSIRYVVPHTTKAPLLMLLSELAARGCASGHPPLRSTSHALDRGMQHQPHPGIAQNPLRVSSENSPRIVCVNCSLTLLPKYYHIFTASLVRTQPLPHPPSCESEVVRQVVFSCMRQGPTHLAGAQAPRSRKCIRDRNSDRELAP